jgi:flagellar basal body-associated protein FliL
MSETEAQESATPGKHRKGHSAPEWITLILSSLVIAAVAGAVGFFTITGGDALPRLPQSLRPRKCVETPRGSTPP